MALKTYDPIEVLVEADGNALSGFAKDTFIDVEFDENQWAKVVTPDGFVSRSKSNNYAGTATLTLMQTSESNKILSDLFALDRSSNDGTFKFSVKDGDNEYLSTEAWVEKGAKLELGGEEKTREWKIALVQIDPAKIEGG